ncbi:DUF2627 family protein [Caldalkalibacillus mannanilyticus]|uniref:DUF2627 family protein n=1 Tax=Caldalkalibacillus mannanilyticus TaxID=1418 RepID=UPI00054DBCF7|nr:DUF2627 family protein [Caldalkalibacillus mannanilyticus]
MKIQRLIALLIVVIPGFLSVWGWKIMRDAIVNPALDPNLGFSWGLFSLGLLLFIFGIAFVGGFIFYRDRKRKLVQPRFRNDLDDKNT